jgi:hypothetical protein
MAWDLLPRQPVAHRCGERDPGGFSVTESVREHLERILASYEQIGTRFASMGGVTKVLGLLEDVRRELEHVSEHDLERVTGDIKQVVESLLKVDYELRKIQNLKLLFEQRNSHETVRPGTLADGEGS